MLAIELVNSITYSASKGPIEISGRVAHEWTAVTGHVKKRTWTAIAQLETSMAVLIERYVSINNNYGVPKLVRRSYFLNHWRSNQERRGYL